MFFLNLQCLLGGFFYFNKIKCVGLCYCEFVIHVKSKSGKVSLTETKGKEKLTLKMTRILFF